MSNLITTQTKHIINELNQSNTTTHHHHHQLNFSSSTSSSKSTSNHHSNSPLTSSPTPSTTTTNTTTSTTTPIQTTSNALPLNHHQLINSSIPTINPQSTSTSSTSSIIIESNHQGSRTFSNQHHDQILKILANIPNQSTSEERNSDQQKVNSLKGSEDSFHPTLRSTQSTHVSTPPSTSQHLHPQFLFSTSDETSLRMNSIISKPSGYPSKTLDPLSQRSPWSTSIDQPSSKKQEDPIPGSSHPNWNPPHSRSSSPPIQDHQPQTNPLACTETRNQDTHQDTHQDPNRDEIDFKIDKRLTEASTLLWNENGNGNEGSDGCSNLNLNGESVDRNSDQWKQHRKNNHKEVERRRRETINEGITELKKIVPGSEKNKGEILKQAVRYIQRLKSMEIEDQEKWRLERMRMEGRMKDQSEEIERLSRECLSLEVENESLKRWIIDLGERSRSDLPQLSIDHSVRTSQSQSSTDELNRIDPPLHESSIMRNQTRDRVHDGQPQDPEDNLHHLLRTATEEFGMKRSKESVDDEEDEQDRSNCCKKSKS